MVTTFVVSIYVVVLTVNLVKVTRSYINNNNSKINGHELERSEGDIEGMEGREGRGNDVNAALMNEIPRIK